MYARFETLVYVDLHTSTGHTNSRERTKDKGHSKYESEDKFNIKLFMLKLNFFKMNQNNIIFIILVKNVMHVTLYTKVRDQLISLEAK